MANYSCAVRTNYFHVKDDEAFRRLMETVRGCEDTVHVWEDKDATGKTVFGFGSYGEIAGIVIPNNEDSESEYDEYDVECDYDEFIKRLQNIVADDDAIIIFESGHENLRYLVGCATILTSTDCQYLNITDFAEETASQMLRNLSWCTKCEY